MKTLLLLLALFFTGCVKTPQDVKAVENFTLKPYLGTWYEVARLDHSFERGMEQISATYTLRDDGGVKVLNKGYLVEEKRWKDAIGKAYFVEGSDMGYLKVSFFGPFYGSYIIMDTDYKTYSLISGPDKSYLWILSRTPTLERKVEDRLIQKAQSLGFETDKLIFVKQER